MPQTRGDIVPQVVLAIAPFRSLPGDLGQSNIGLDGCDWRTYSARTPGLGSDDRSLRDEQPMHRRCGFVMAAGAALLLSSSLLQSRAAAGDLGGSVPGGWLVMSEVNVSARDQTGLNIYVIKPDGTNKRYLTTSSGNGAQFAFPAWSYDGTKIVYAKLEAGNASIWIMNSDGSEKRQLTFPPMRTVMPSFSPDGKHIVFVGLSETGKAQLSLMNADGTNPHELIALSEDGGTPSFSPDGKKIVFSATEAGRPQVWIMNGDGSEPRRLTSAIPSAPDANAPSWAPDGTKIAFWSGDEMKGGDIWTMNPDGSGRQRVTFSFPPHNSDNPAWSPDGQHIMFESSLDSLGVRTWIVSAGGGNPRLLLPTSYGLGRRPWKSD